MKKIPIILAITFGIGLSECEVQAVEAPSSLTYEQREALSKMKADMKAQSQLSKACQLVGEGKDDDAMKVLQQIEWWSTSIKISKSGVNNEENKIVINFFKRFDKLNEENCVRYSTELFNDSL
jgi:hypothetical protein